MLNDFIENFHFIRPLWLYALVLLPVISWLLWRIKETSHQWQHLVDKQLLSHLIVGSNAKQSFWPSALLAVLWLLAVIALAGPSWQKLPQPQFVNQKPLVLLVDLSPSMMVEDIKPSRLAQMRFKLIDFLKVRKEGLTGLVVYAGDAHVLAPLSDDSKTLISLVPTLAPNIMPVSGSRTEEGMAVAISLIESQGYKRGDIVLFTDGITPTAKRNVEAALADSDIRLSIIGVGSSQGAPIPMSDKNFAKDKSGNIVLAKLNRQPLKQLASNHGGIYVDLDLASADIDAVLKLDDGLGDDDLAFSQDNKEMDQWDDVGQWLMLLILPIFLLSFRRGWLLQIGIVCLFSSALLKPTPVMALGLDDLWKSANQQGADAFKNKDYVTAASKFTDSGWQAAAQYESGDFASAADSFAQLNTADGYYNQGNALAKQGELKQAGIAYDKSLALNPDLTDAKANKALVKKMLEKKKEKEKKKQQDEKKGDKKGDKKEDQKDQDKKEGESKDKQKGKDKKDDKSSDDKSKDSKKEKGDDKSEAEQKKSDEKGQKDQEGKQDDEKTAQQKLEKLKKEQQQKEQQALQAKEANKEKPKDAKQMQAAQISPEQRAKDQELENWLGQLPEDASRLVRNKFNYEYQKKRQAYRNGQWQPTKEQRW